MTTSSDLSVFILDSFALLTFFGGEPGMERVKTILQDSAAGRCRALLSVINLGEVIYIVERKGGLAKAQMTLAAIDQLALEMVPASREMVLRAAHLKATYPIAYADAFAAAAAQAENGILVTGDPEFAAFKGGLRIEWLVSQV